MAAAIRKNIDSEISIRTGRILKVLDETIAKIELALCLPIFFKNLERFKNQLSKDELITLTKCESHQHQCTKEQETISLPAEEETNLLKSSNSLSESQHSTIRNGAEHFSMQYEQPKINDAEDPSVKRAIYILWKCPDLVNVAKNEYIKLARESSGFIFLENMRALRQCVSTRMMEDRSPEAERKKTLYYKDIWCKNDEAITKINSMKPLLNDIQTHFQVGLESKNKLISEMQSCLKELEIEFKEEVEKICDYSKKTMVVERESSEAREEVILNDIRHLDETYQYTLDEHLMLEKELREKRLQIESQLEKCLVTYDSDMGERQAEYEEILAEYEEEQRQMAYLQERFDEQENEYIILMEEKAYEEHLLIERRIEDLRRRVAARIIQTHWRAYKQRKLDRAKSKKARKGKGKKK